MEYTFKNSLNHSPCTILLSEYDMSVQSAKQERTISYASVTSIRLSKSNGKNFKTIINVDNEESVEVANCFCLKDGTKEYRSHQYETFIRVLHFHLKQKSSATYFSGNSWDKILFVAMGCLISSFLLSIAMDFLRISILDILTQTLLITTLIAGFLISASWPFWPHRYSPDQIPSRFLS